MTIEREIPAGVRREIDRQESPEFYLTFLTIWHRVLVEPIRVVSDPEPFILKDSEGVEHTYNPWSFAIQILSDGEGMPVASLTIQNINRRIGQAIQNAEEPARMMIEVIAGSEFDITENPRVELSTAERFYVAEHLILHGVEANAMQLRGSIRTWDYTQEIWPGMYATKDRFPGLFR